MSDEAISDGVLLRTSGVPDEPAKQKVYVFGAKTPERPAGRTEK